MVWSWVTRLPRDSKTCLRVRKHGTRQIPQGIGTATVPGENLVKQFQVQVFDVVGNNYNKVFDSGTLSTRNARLSINGVTGSWVPSNADWQTILQSGLRNKVFVVLGIDHHSNLRQTRGEAFLDEYVSGPYRSDVFGFTVNP